MLVYHSLKDIAMPRPRSCVALGMFDGLHLGHRTVIDAAVDMAREEGHCSCVFTFSFGHHHPAAKPARGRLYTPTLREQLLTRRGVNVLICPPFDEFRELTPEGYVQELLYHRLYAAHVFCGENYHFGKGGVAGVEDLRRLCTEQGIRVHTLPLVDVAGNTASSTRIRAYVERGEMEMAAKLLGRLFAIDFEVVHGRQLGRTLDSPTINQPFPDWYACPRFGVYATLTTVDGVRHVSVSNVGMKPTVGSEELLSETYIHGFRGDLYGRRVLVEFLEFLRPEKKFTSIEELRAQIFTDRERALHIGWRYFDRLEGMAPGETI